LGFGVGYYYPVSDDNLELFIKFQSGCSYTSLTLDEMKNNNNINYVDFFGMAGMGCRVYLNKNYFVETICAGESVFYSKSYFHTIQLSFFCGVKL